MTVPRILPRAEHPISRGYIDPDALRVLYRLHRAGFKAYLVGGSVRDLMTGRTPKDFDVGTDASPQEVRRLFRNSRVIGRRFRLVHILFEGGKVVEVSTFRKTPDAVQGEQGQEGDEDLLIRSDNTFGTPEEDAVRRDFTINGLFYDIATYAVLDYVGGVDDLERPRRAHDRRPAHPLPRGPGPHAPGVRVRGAALASRWTPALRAAIDELRREVTKSAAPRVTEELLDPLRRGWGHDTYRLWSETGLFGALLPEVDGEAGVHAPEGPAKDGFWAMLREADARTAGGERLDDAALLGALFLPVVFAAVRRRGRPDASAGPDADPPRPRGRREPARDPDVAPEPHDAHAQAGALHDGAPHVDAPGRSRRAPPRRPPVLPRRGLAPLALREGDEPLPRGRRRVGGGRLARGRDARPARRPRSPTPSCRRPSPGPSPPDAGPARRKRRRRGRGPRPRRHGLIPQRARRSSQSARSDSTRG